MPRNAVKDHPNRVNESIPDDAERQRRDFERVARNAEARLVKLGIPIDERDSSHDRIAILEAVERFENVVRGRGGDLMVDEPPPGRRPQPDHEAHALPIRAEGEPAQLYVERLERAATRLTEPAPPS